MGRRGLLGKSGRSGNVSQIPGAAKGELKPIHRRALLLLDTLSGVWYNTASFSSVTEMVSFLVRLWGKWVACIAATL